MIVKKIKTWLIHRLGGLTVSESRENLPTNFSFGAYFGAHTALYAVKEYADSLNGKPADEWCKLVYKQICKQLESVTHGIDEERPTAHS